MKYSLKAQALQVPAVLPFPEAQIPQVVLELQVVHVAPQEEHVDAVPSEYVPATHAVQVPPLKEELVLQLVQVSGEAGQVEQLVFVHRAQVWVVPVVFRPNPVEHVTHGPTGHESQPFITGQADQVSCNNPSKTTGAKTNEAFIC